MVCTIDDGAHLKRVQIIASPSAKLARRRTHDAAFKRRLVELTLAPRASVARIALDHRLNANILFRWRREHLRALARSVAAPVPAMLPVTLMESEISIAENRQYMVRADRDSDSDGGAVHRTYLSGFGSRQPAGQCAAQVLRYRGDIVSPTFSDANGSSIKTMDGLTASARDTDTLTHTGGKLSRIPLLESTQSHESDGVVDEPALLGLGYTLALQPVTNVLYHGIPGKQRVFHEHHRAFPSWFLDQLAANVQFAARRLLESGKQIEQSSFTASAWTHDREELVFRDLEVQLPATP